MLKKTPLHNFHVTHKAKMAPFAGWDMPIFYSSILAEHNAVRHAAGLFDVSHMRQYEVRGKAARAFLNKISTNDCSALVPGRAQYGHMLNESGGIVDDIFVYCLAPERFIIVGNAATAATDWQWLNQHRTDGVALTCLNDAGSGQESATGMVALQGPKAPAILAQMFSDLPALRGVKETLWQEQWIFICRTGYTGEDGFECILPAQPAQALWNAILDLGGVTPIGLGARDTLRLEYGFLLYGQDADASRSSLETGPSWVIKLQKPDFIGKAALLQQQERGIKEKLTGFILTERGVPRHGCSIWGGADGQVKVGTVTSGSFSPTLSQGIALGFLETNAAAPYFIECHGRKIPAEKVTPPFVQKTVARQPNRM